MRKPINPYTLIYYIKGHRFEIRFGSSSYPQFWVSSIADTSNFFEDKKLTDYVWKNIKSSKDNTLMGLILKLNKILKTECMAFNHNA